MLLVATGFGLGHSPVMPGTVGTLLALPIFFAMREAGLDQGAQIAVAVALVAACVPVCTAAEKAIGTKDPPRIVCDEYASFLLVLACAPTGEYDWAYWAGAFVLFRSLDIAKPWPLATAQRLSGGWGIMADDLLAAAGALLVVWLFGLV